MSKITVKKNTDLETIQEDVEQLKPVDEEKCACVIPRSSAAKKISEVMKRVTFISKDGVVKFGNTKYNYTKEEDITLAVREACIEVGLVCIPVKCEPVNNSGQLASVNITYKLIDIETGDFEICQMIGEGQDSGDKKYYKAETGAFKYFQRQSFMIPTSDSDPDKYPSPQASKTTFKPTTDVKPIPVTTDYLQTTVAIGKYAGKTIEEIAKLNPGYIKWLAGKQGDLQGIAQKAIEDLKL